MRIKIYSEVPIERWQARMAEAALAIKENKGVVLNYKVFAGDDANCSVIELEDVKFKAHGWRAGMQIKMLETTFSMFLKKNDINAKMVFEQ